MENINNLIKESVYNSPLTLLAIKDEKLLLEANNYLPYSTGFEIECNTGKDFHINNFKAIPDIMDIDISGGEQRYRIPNGVKGLICLYNISIQLKRNSELNPLSGIHYHVDMTDCFDRINSSFIRKNKDWILKELDSWEYKGTYNKRSIGEGHEWIRLQSGFKTAEFRLGEMTFDYELLVKRIIHCNDIVRRLKGLLYLNDSNYADSLIKYESVDSKKILNYITNHAYNNKGKIDSLYKKLNELNPVDFPKEDEIKRIISSRVIKIKKK